MNDFMGENVSGFQGNVNSLLGNCESTGATIITANTRGGGVSRPTPGGSPGPHPGGVSGLQTHTGGGSPGPHPRGCIPACTEADPPS